MVQLTLKKNMKIQPIDKEEVGKLAYEMRKAGVAFKAQDTTTYLGMYDEKGILAGVVGWQKMGDAVRYKTAYVKATHRGQGIYKALWQARDEAVKQAFGKGVRITAFCSPNSLPTFLQNGFVEVKKNAKSGVVFVQNIPGHPSKARIGSYKHWTSEQRLTSLALTKKAKRLGLIPLPTQCSVCGTTKGNLQHHNPDYDFTLNTLPKVFNGELAVDDALGEKIKNCLIPICPKCHIELHRREKQSE